MVLLDKVDDGSTRDWYADQADAHGWSRNVLLNQIMSRAHERVGAAPSDFVHQLTAGDSELAQQLAKDPYVFDFLGLSRGIGKFKPDYTGQLGFYINLVEGRLRLAQHQPTVGLLLCADRNESTVRYALGASHAPMAVATYTYDNLPAAERASLPSDTQVISAIGTSWSVATED